jgi:hypothetical protein
MFWLRLARILRSLARTTVAATVLLAAGCASVPFDHPKTESVAVAPSDATRLGRSGADWLEAHPG